MTRNADQTALYAATLYFYSKPEAYRAVPSPENSRENDSAYTS